MDMDHGEGAPLCFCLADGRWVKEVRTCLADATPREL